MAKIIMKIMSNEKLMKAMKVKINENEIMAKK
jgi:hypothetical protein